MIQKGLFYLFSTFAWEQTKKKKYIVQLGHNLACLPSVAGGVLFCYGLSSSKTADEVLCKGAIHEQTTQSIGKWSVE